MIRANIAILCVMSCCFVFLDAPVHAQSFTVDQLHKHCRAYLKLAKKTKGGYAKSQVIDIVKCNSYIAGFHLGKIATNVENNTIGPYCLPRGDNTTTDWLIGTFVNWAARHKRDRRKVAGYGVMKSLQEHYACDQGERN